jgi:hypothetical protein
MISSVLYLQEELSRLRVLVLNLQEDNDKLASHIALLRIGRADNDAIVPPDAPVVRVRGVEYSSDGVANLNPSRNLVSRHHTGSTEHHAKGERDPLKEISRVQAENIKLREALEQLVQENEEMSQRMVEAAFTAGGHSAAMDSFERVDIIGRSTIGALHSVTARRNGLIDDGAGLDLSPCGDDCDAGDLKANACRIVEDVHGLDANYY